MENPVDRAQGGARGTNPPERRKVRILVAMATAAGVAGVLLAGRFLLNLHFMREYDAGRYDAAIPQALTYVNAAEPWVAYHNLGCAAYMLGSYDLAEGVCVQALDTDPPHDGDYPDCECDIRLNLALSIVRPLDLGWETEAERSSLVAALSRARDHLTDEGCANPEKGVYDGHFDKAEQLKKEIDEALERLSDPDSRGGGGDDSQDDDDSDGQSQGGGGESRGESNLKDKLSARRSDAAKERAQEQHDAQGEQQREQQQQQGGGGAQGGKGGGDDDGSAGSAPPVGARGSRSDGDPSGTVPAKTW